MAPTPDRYIAAYPTLGEVKATISEIEQAGFDVIDLRIDDPDDRRASLQADQQEEAGAAAPMASSGVITPHQAKGALSGIAGTIPIGLVLGGLVGLIPFTDGSILVRVAFCAVIGAVAASAVGFVVGGGLGADGPAEANLTEECTVLGLHSPDATVERVLGRRAQRLRRLDPNDPEIHRLADRGETGTGPSPLLDHLDQPAGGTWAEDQQGVERTDDA